MSAYVSVAVVMCCCTLRWFTSVVAVECHTVTFLAAFGSGCSSDSTLRSNVLGICSDVYGRVYSTVLDSRCDGTLWTAGYDIRISISTTVYNSRPSNITQLNKKILYRVYYAECIMPGLLYRVFISNVYVECILCNVHTRTTIL